MQVFTESTGVLVLLVAVDCPDAHVVLEHFATVIDAHQIALARATPAVDRHVGILLTRARPEQTRRAARLAQRHSAFELQGRTTQRRGSGERARFDAPRTTG